MRGQFLDQGGLFSYISPEKRVAANHPLRKVRDLAAIMQRFDGYTAHASPHA